MRHVLHQATILSRGSAASRAGDNKVGKLPIRKTRTTFGKSRLPESRRQPVREWLLSVYRDPERTTSHRLAGFMSVATIRASPMPAVIGVGSGRIAAMD